MWKFLKSCLICLIFLTSCVGLPPTTFAPTPTPTSTPTSTPRPTLTQLSLPRLSQLFVQKVEKPSLEVDFGDITTLRGEYFIFKEHPNVNYRTPPPYDFRNYKYQSWSDPKQQGRLFDLWETERDSPSRILLSISASIIHFTQYDFWLATEGASSLRPSSPVNKDRLIKFDMRQRKYEMYAFESSCRVDVNGKDRMKGHEFSKPIALEYFPVFVSDCPQPAQNGVALFSLAHQTITHFFPLGSPQYPTLYQIATWLTPDTLALVSDKDTCVLKLTIPVSPCHKFPYTLLTLPLLSPDGNWFIREDVSLIIDPLSCQDRTYVLCDPSQIDSTRLPHLETHLSFRFSYSDSGNNRFTQHAYWSPDSLKIATISTRFPDPSPTSGKSGVALPSSSIEGVYHLSSRQSKTDVEKRLFPEYRVVEKLIWSSQNENTFLLAYDSPIVRIMDWRTSEMFETNGWFQGVFFIP